jgi:hypothetical protein
LTSRTARLISTRHPTPGGAAPDLPFRQMNLPQALLVGTRTVIPMLGLGSLSAKPARSIPFLNSHVSEPSKASRKVVLHSCRRQCTAQRHGA